MKICNLLNGLDYKCFGSVNKRIEHIAFNSNLCKRKTLFFCINGTKANGFIYINDAIKNGAIAVVLDSNNYKKYLTLKDENICKNDLVNIRANNKKMERSNSSQSLNNNKDVSFIVVNNVRKAMAIMSANFYNNPQNKLKIIGITGTNGKTSCSYLIANMLKSLNKKVGVIGTNGVYVNNKKYDANMTTPDSIDLFKIFAKMVKAKVEFCVMEVSAHAIYFDKVYGINFAVKALTNVKADHLDFFKTKANYAKTKIRFFDNLNNIVINADDKIGKKIAKNNKKSITFGQKNVNFLIFNTKCKLGKTFFNINYQNKIYKVVSNLTGKFNIYNLTLCICVLQNLGFDINEIIKTINNIKNIDGRFDVVYQDDKLNIIIDYAHTVDSLKNLLQTVKQTSNNYNIIVFGCPGERDTTKRFLMGKLAGEFCDCVILTTDNPASENPLRIMFEIEQGVKSVISKKSCFLIENRKKAIKKAYILGKKQKKCNILIVGKGIENYQINGDRFVKYSDYEAIQSILTVKK